MSGLLGLVLTRLEWGKMTGNWLVASVTIFSSAYKRSVSAIHYGVTTMFILALLTVSRQGQLIRSWDTTSGHLRYEILTSLPPPLHPGPTPLHRIWRVGGVHATLAGKKGGVAIVGSMGAVVGLVTRSGEQKWKFPLETEGRLEENCNNSIDSDKLCK